MSGGIEQWKLQSKEELAKEVENLSAIIRRYPRDIYLVTGEGIPPLVTLRAFHTLDEAKGFIDEQRGEERWLDDDGNASAIHYIGWKWSIQAIRLGRYSDGS